MSADSTTELKNKTNKKKKFVTHLLYNIRQSGYNVIFTRGWALLYKYILVPSSEADSRNVLSGLKEVL